jgi:hypothetical protein
MKRAFLMSTLLAVAAGCGASFPPPHDQMASATKEVGRAEQGGASAVPDAKLHLALAQQALAEAKELFEKDNKRAASLISRANAEAELALALSNENKARNEARAAVDQLKAVKK